MQLTEPPQAARIPAWRRPGPRQWQRDVLEAYYKSQCARDDLGDLLERAVSVSYGGPHIQVRRAAQGGDLRTEAKHATLLNGTVDSVAKLRANYPAHVVQYAVPLVQRAITQGVAGLPVKWALALKACYIDGVPVQEYAALTAAAGHRAATVQDWLGQGLHAVACLLWDSDSHVRISPELE